MAVPPVYVDRSTASEQEVSEDIDQKLEDLFRWEVQGASTFGSASF